MIAKKHQVLGAIRVLRPQFLVAYLIVGLGGLVVGIAQGYELTNKSLGFYAFLPIIISAMGVHLRDEAGDWLAGYDTAHGGMGVIRDGIFSVKAIKTWGILLTLFGVTIGIFQALEYLIMFVVGIPMLIVIIFTNFLTEQVLTGHELITAGSYWGSFLWIYLAQKWPLTMSILLFSLFMYVIVLALIPYQDIGDYAVDAESGKKTLTVKLGLDGIGHLSIFIALMALLILYIALLISI
jgi:4-hydroxybenzoate polyprenyltransferase